MKCPGVKYIWSEWPISWRYFYFYRDWALLSCGAPPGPRTSDTEVSRKYRKYSRNNATSAANWCQGHWRQWLTRALTGAKLLCRNLLTMSMPHMTLKLNTSCVRLNNDNLPGGNNEDTVGAGAGAGRSCLLSGSGARPDKKYFYHNNKQQNVTLLVNHKLETRWVLANDFPFLITKFHW